MWYRSASGSTPTRAFGRNSQRTRSDTPGTRGTVSAIMPSRRGTSGCQPIQATA